MLSSMEFSPKRERKRLRRLLKKWRQPLGLDHWFIHMNYDLGYIHVEDCGHYSGNVAGSASVDWPYLSASLTFDLTVTCQLPDGELEECFVHECMHILIRETREWGDKDAMRHEERVCTNLARAFINTRRAGGLSL